MVSLHAVVILCLCFFAKLLDLMIFLMQIRSCVLDLDLDYTPFYLSDFIEN